MFEFLSRFLGAREQTGSGHAAKERLRLVLVHDRASVAPELLDMLKEDLLQVISRYLEVDSAGLAVALERSEDSVALVANIPIRRVRRAAGRYGHAEA